MKLTDVKKGLMVKMLLEKNLYQTGLAFELDKHYKDSDAVKAAVYRAYQQVSKNPQKFFTTQETVDAVKQKMRERLPSTIREAQPTLRETTDAEANKDIKELVMDGRKKAFKILMKKLDRIEKSNKTLDEANVSSLAQVFGIIFDKAQIIQGEATENVAVLAKIDQNMKPEDALAAVLRMRETNQIDKERKKK